MEFNDILLDDRQALVDADSGQMLLATASAGALMRAASGTVDRELVNGIAADGRPRAVVVAGGGGSTAAGDILAAVAGVGSPVPVFRTSGPTLPGWVGPTDLVVAVSASGMTSETVTTVGEAVRRGSRLASVCPPRSAVADATRMDRSAAVFAIPSLPDLQNLRARTLLWALAAPLLMIGGRLGLVDECEAAIDRAADSLDAIAAANGPVVPMGENFAKQLAVDVGTSLPVIWGTGDVGAVAAARFSRQLSENAGFPSVVGNVPEAVRVQSTLFTGPRSGGSDVDDIFRDRVDDPEPDSRLRLVMLRDADEETGTQSIADRGIEIALANGLAVSTVSADFGHPLDRLVALMGPTDFASVYAALALGIDPTPGARELGID